MNNIATDLSSRFRNKSVLLAAIAVVLAVLIAACGSAATAVPVAPTGAAAGDTGTSVPTTAGPTLLQSTEANTAAPQPTAADTTAFDTGGPAPTAANAEAPTLNRQPALGSSMETGGEVGDFAPEFAGIAGWINSDPLTMTELQGRVVLIDFWTYTCINCIRTYPFLKLWNSRYADDGLVIVGVHTPEFEFEKDFDNVADASQKDGIVWPIAQDNDFRTWRAFSNRFWPAKYLIDKDGLVRYTHFGEGAYAETEEIIRELLIEAGAELNDENLPLPADQVVDSTFLTSSNGEVTRELYGGYERGRNDLLYGQGGYVHQELYYQTINTIANLEEPDELDPHVIYFQGPWYIGPESARHATESNGYEDSLCLVYSARSVNAVLTSDSGEPYKVRLTVGGDYLTNENKGTDIIIGDDGESYLWVTEAKLYNIIENPSWERREKLRMSSNSDDFGLFAFTFGVYEKETS